MTHAMTKVVVVALTLLATAAQAQVEDPVLEPGRPRVGEGRVGLRALFGGNSTVIPGVGSVGSVGLNFMLTDALAFNVDFGAALDVPQGGGAGFGFGVKPGLTYYFVPGPLRPFITGGAGVGSQNVQSAGWDLGLDVGGGAEYFFNRNVSVAIRALLPFLFEDVGGAFAFRSGTVTPGVGLSLFF